ncbi:hypothetical protein BDR03DRAFT_36891 [Suillus americanus]|nr:hypothetical protein BDR03DRAFT_36891 [Suillus americanus]
MLLDNDSRCLVPCYHLDVSRFLQTTSNPERTKSGHPHVNEKTPDSAQHLGFSLHVSAQAAAVTCSWQFTLPIFRFLIPSISVSASSWDVFFMDGRTLPHSTGYSLLQLVNDLDLSIHQCIHPILSLLVYERSEPPT